MNFLLRNKIKIIVTSILLLLVIILYQWCNRVYTSKDVMHFLKEKYELDDILLLSEESLPDDRRTKNRYLYTYKAGNIEFTVMTEDYKYDLNISYTRKTVTNYHKRLVLENNKIREVIENSVYEWYIEDEKYVICWNEFDELPEICELVEQILNLQEKIIDNGDKYISYDYAPVVINVMGESNSNFSFRRNKDEAATQEDIYNLLIKEYQQIEEIWEADISYKQLILDNQDIEKVIENSGYEWYVDEETMNYVIRLNEYKDIWSIGNLIFRVLELQEPIEKHRYSFTKAAEIEVKMMDEVYVSFRFPYGSENEITKDEIYERLTTEFEKIN